MDSKKTDRIPLEWTSLLPSKMTNSLIVKIAFVLDCTGSMDPWIYEAKTKIQEIVTSSEVPPGAQFEIAVVAYRDYGDVVRRRIIDFTGPHEAEHFLQNIYAEGGDDEAEDVAGALDRVCGLTWGPSDVRMVFHIADAPAHGRMFHAPQVSDRFPDGDPEGKDPRDSLRHLAYQDVKFTFVRITTSTDMMIGVFDEIYRREGGEFVVIDLHPQSYNGEYGVRHGNMSDLLFPAVTQVVSATVSRHTSSQGR